MTILHTNGKKSRLFSILLQNSQKNNKNVKNLRNEYHTEGVQVLKAEKYLADLSV